MHGHEQGIMGNPLKLLAILLLIQTKCLINHSNKMLAISIQNHSSTCIAHHWNDFKCDY